jgi:anti-sigma factor RsiW
VQSEHPTTEDIAALLDGTLTDANRAEVKAHLRVCKSCTAIVLLALTLLDGTNAEPER